MKTQEFDQKFDDGEDEIISLLDLTQAQRCLTKQQIVQTINIDLPLWMIEYINQEAHRLGVTPQALIQNSLSKHLMVNHD
jgi:hypothetical protein